MLRKNIQKLDIEIPTSFNHAYGIDKANRNTFWKNSIQIEMKNNGVAFEILNHDKNIPVE